MNWELALAALSIIVTVMLAVITAVWVITGRMSKDRNEQAQQISTVNNAMLTQMQLMEERFDQSISHIVQKFDARTLEIERDLAQFKAYCERNFLSKDTFNTVMSAQSSERNAMRAELLDRFNRLENRLEQLRGDS